MLARLGGDEFSLLLRPIDKPADAAAIAERIVKTMATPFTIDGHQIAIGASVGIAIAPQDGETTDVLMKNADMALYRAKIGRPFDLPLLREGHGRRDPEAAHDRGGPARRAGAQRVARWCSSRWSGSRKTASPASRRCCAGRMTARRDLAGRVHPDRRGDRPHRADRRVGAARGLPHRRRRGRRDARVAVNLSPVQFKNKRLFETVHAHPRRDRPAADPARARDHRVAAAQRQRADAADPAPAARHRHPHLDGRFRHRLFVAELSARLPVRQDQDRPLVHARSRKPRRQPRHHQGGDRARPFARHVDHRRGRRDRGAAQGRARAGLQRGAGLPVLAAARAGPGAGAARQRRQPRRCCARPADRPMCQ